MLPQQIQRKLRPLLGRQVRILRLGDLRVPQRRDAAVGLDVVDHLHGLLHAGVLLAELGLDGVEVFVEAALADAAGSEAAWVEVVAPGIGEGEAGGGRVGDFGAGHVLDARAEGEEGVGGGEPVAVPGGLLLDPFDPAHGNGVVDYWVLDSWPLSRDGSSVLAEFLTWKDVWGVCDVKDELLVLVSRKETGNRIFSGTRTIDNLFQQD